MICIYSPYAFNFSCIVSAINRDIAPFRAGRLLPDQKFAIKKEEEKKERMTVKEGERVIRAVFCCC